MSASKSRRRLERLELELPVRVHCRESEDHDWTETSRLLDVTPFGARLRLTQPTEPGRLLHLTMPLPRELRSYDHDEVQYRTYALVRHAQPLAPAEDRLPQFQIGVAFVGKSPPESSETDPALRYEIASVPVENNLWGVRERPEMDAAVERASERRSEMRHPIAAEVVVEVYDAEGRVFASETTRTENISRRGMLVTTRLSIMRGRYVRVRSSEYRIAVIAAVRRLRRSADGQKRLHLEFVDQQWPPLDA